MTIDDRGGLVSIYEFWKAYSQAPCDAHVEVHIGPILGWEGDRVIVSLIVDERRPVSIAVSAEEARAFAEVMARAIELFPDQPSTVNLPDLILNLRLFADRLDA